MRFFLFYLLLIFFCGNVTAQQSQPTPITQEDLVRLGNLPGAFAGVQGFDTRYEGVKGSPLLREDWQNGAVWFSGQENYSPVLPIHLDLYNTQVFFQLKNGQVSSIFAQAVEKIRFRNEAGEDAIFQVGSIKAPDAERGDDLLFYEVLHQGRFTLLKARWKQLREANYKGAYSAGRTYDEFISNHVYWLKAEGGKFSRVKPQRRSLEKALPDHAPAIRRFWKERPSGKGDEEVLLKLLEKLEEGGG